MPLEYIKEASILLAIKLIRYIVNWTIFLGFRDSNIYEEIYISRSS